MFIFISLFIFFFQAEDGIRYLYVTGVQTCALPIFEDLALLVADVHEHAFRVAELVDRVDRAAEVARARMRSEEHTSELQSRRDLVCRLLLEKKKKRKKRINTSVMNNKIDVQSNANY